MEPHLHLSCPDFPPGSPSAGRSGPGSVPGTSVPWLPSAPACRLGESARCCAARPPLAPEQLCCLECCLATPNLCHFHGAVVSIKGDNLWRKKYIPAGYFMFILVELIFECKV